jgi:hypothetical protein
MKLLNIETPVTRNFIQQILLNVQYFYFNKVSYISYNEGIFRPLTEHICISGQVSAPLVRSIEQAGKLCRGLQRKTNKGNICPQHKSCFAMFFSADMGYVMCERVN